MAIRRMAWTSLGGEAHDYLVWTLLCSWPYNLCREYAGKAADNAGNTCPTASYGLDVGRRGWLQPSHGCRRGGNAQCAQGNASVLDRPPHHPTSRPDS